MNNQIKGYLLVAWATGILMLLSSSMAQAVSPDCDATLTADTKLDSDMNCIGTALHLAGKASKKITLNCDGFSIDVVNGPGILVENVTGATIKDCNISTNGYASHGIVLSAGSTKNLIKDNWITTTGRNSRGIELLDSSENRISSNTLDTSNTEGNAIRLRSGSDNNLVSDNTLITAASHAISIESSSKNRIHDNWLESTHGFLMQRNLALQSGGLGVDSSGNIYAVDNNQGSSGGIGSATAFFLVDPLTGLANNVLPLLVGVDDIGIGFDALEVLPGGRILALSSFGAAATLYEINQNGQVTSIPLSLDGSISGRPNGLEATSDTNLLATTDLGELLEINLITNSVTEIGSQGIGLTDLASHPSNGKTYAVSLHADEGSNTGHLYEINVSTGQLVIDLGDTGSSDLSDIDFAMDGTLYANSDGKLAVVDILDGSLTFTTDSFGPDPLEPLSRKTRLRGNLMQNAHGSIGFNDSITIPAKIETDISVIFLEIAANQVMVDSTELPFLDTPARITLENLAGTYRKLLVDPEDDGSFTPCKPSRCKFVSFLNGRLVFDVKGFSTYSSEENADPTLQFVSAAVLAEIETALAESDLAKSSKKILENARRAMSKALKFLKQGKIKKVFVQIAVAVKNLKKLKTKLPIATTLIDMLAQAAKAEARAAITSATWSLGDAALIARAETSMTEAQNLLLLGKSDKAIKALQTAWWNADKADTGLGDQIPPVVVAPADLLVVAADPAGEPAANPDIQAFLGGASATDNADGDLTAGVFHDAPATFLPGMTTVIFSVIDAAGNTGTASAIVEIVEPDDEAPGFATVVINNNAPYALSVSQFSARLMASDNVGVTAYLVTEHNATNPGNILPPYVDPLPADGGWVAIAATSSLDTTIQFPLAQSHALGDTIELCAWFKDAQENISTRVCDAIFYGYDWENGTGTWFADNGVWQIGIPNAGPDSCFSGSQCAGTVLNGNYPDDTASRLVSGALQLPTLAGSEEIHLRFRNWFSYGTGDSGQVQVSVWDADAQTWGSWISEGDAVSGSSDWSVKDVELTAYAGEKLRIGFLHTESSISVSTGWYIDDVQIVSKLPQASGDFEAGWVDWGAGGGVWQIGTPGAGPDACFSGSQCAGTILDGVYADATNSRLVSATMQLPTVGAIEEIHLRFQNWFSYETGDSGQVQVSVWDANTSSWGNWLSEGDALSGSSEWSVKDVGLTAYAGETVRIGFLHTESSIGVSTGWYIDDIEIVSKLPAFSGDFESGWDDWSASRGVWQVGVPGSGPDDCFAGSQCAGTILDGNYPDATNSRLVSATLQLPTVDAFEEIHLRFQNWFSYEVGDSGRVQIAVWDAGTSTWGSWINKGTVASNESGGWTLNDVTLTSYAGETIRVGFLHTESSIGVDAGWYIDAVEIAVF